MTSQRATNTMNLYESREERCVRCGGTSFYWSDDRRECKRCGKEHICPRKDNVLAGTHWVSLRKKRRKVTRKGGE